MSNFITIKTLDGVEVEITHADAGCPPDGTGQRLNTTAVWIRPKDKEWMRSRFRSAMQVADAVKRAESTNLASAVGVLLELDIKKEKP